MEDNHDECLRSRPEDQDALDTAADWLIAARPILETRPGFIRASRRRMEARARAHYGRNPWLMWRWSAIRWWQSPRLHVAMVVLLVATVYFNVVGIGQAAYAWLPGDLLYPLRPAGENLTLMLTLSPEKDAQLHIEYAHRRLIEVQSLVLENRAEQIPAAVANFDYHVSRAVDLVEGMAGTERDRARFLAVSLEQTLSGQMGMMTLFAGLTRGPERIEFERMMTISTNGMSAVRNAIAPDSSMVQPDRAPQA